MLPSQKHARTEEEVTLLKARMSRGKLEKLRRRTDNRSGSRTNHRSLFADRDCWNGGNDGSSEQRKRGKVTCTRKKSARGGVGVVRDPLEYQAAERALHLKNPGSEKMVLEKSPQHKQQNKERKETLQRGKEAGSKEGKGQQVTLASVAQKDQSAKHKEQEYDGALTGKGSRGMWPETCQPSA